MVGRQMEAIVFGLFETGLGVIRSLGQKGIKVTGIDFKKDIGWYSRYVKPLRCPHPLQQEKEFIAWIQMTFSGDEQKRPVFFTSDDFLVSFSRNRRVLSNYFLFNLVDHSLLERISNKYSQFQLASKAGIDLPSTWLINKESDLKSLPENVHYPVFIKGQDVNSWRREISGSVKVFLVKDFQELHNKVEEIIKKKVPVILQEVIEGPDTNHFKYCSYTTSGGEILAEFTLQKIRQNPIHFGVGAVVESIYKPELIETGRKLFSAIGFIGVGSAEFKLDNRDGKLNLIEINPRYWQQNYLATACGMNFPLIDYQADGPTGTASGFVRDTGLMLISINWELGAGVSCAADQPISACSLTPDQQTYMVEIDFAQYKADFSLDGKWEDPTTGFTLKLNQEWKLISGGHAVVAQNYNKIDALDDSISGKLKGKTADVQFKSSFTDSVGTAQITYIDVNTIQWKVFTPPISENYFPAETTLTRK